MGIIKLSLQVTSRRTFILRTRAETNIEQLQVRKVHELNFTPYSGWEGEREIEDIWDAFFFLRKIFVSKGKK